MRTQRKHLLDSKSLWQEKMSESGLNLSLIRGSAKGRQPDGQDLAWHSFLGFDVPSEHEQFIARHHLTKPLSG